jgi:tripartite-type tricarboxylate transporter receptor subunit TctC
MRTSLSRRHLLALPAALALPSVQAQAWPSKPVRLIVPFAPGGSTDVLGRMLGQKLSDVWGQPVVVENRAGAGGNVGADIVAKSAPDGHTFLFASGSITINPAIYPTMPFDTMRDLTPIANVASGPMLVVVQDKSPWKNLKDLIAHAKANPGKVNFGSAGVGSQVHMASEKLADEAGIELTHVPYRGESVALTDLIGGQIQVIVGNYTAASQLIGPGRLRALAITSSTRSPLMPDVPTVAESGIPRFEYAGWFGLLGPAGLPKNMVDRIHADTVRAMNDSVVRGRLYVIGMKPVLSNPAELTAQMDSELKGWAQIVSKRKIKVN